MRRYKERREHIADGDADMLKTAFGRDSVSRSRLHFQLDTDAVGREDRLCAPEAAIPPKEQSSHANAGALLRARLSQQLALRYYLSTSFRFAASG